MIAADPLDTTNQDTTAQHSEHDEQRDLDGCADCRAEFEAAYREYAWMADAVKRIDFNPYAPTPIEWAS